MSAGSVTTGGVVSATAIVKLPVAVFPAPSLVEHVTTVEPIGKVAPDDGVQVTATAPSTMSVADAVNVATAPAESYSPRRPDSTAASGPAPPYRGL